MKKQFKIEISVTMSINYEVINGEVVFSPEDQKIIVNRLYVKPGLEIKTFKGLSYYDGDAQTIIREATSKLTGKTDNKNERISVKSDISKKQDDSDLPETARNELKKAEEEILKKENSKIQPPLNTDDDLQDSPLTDLTNDDNDDERLNEDMTTSSSGGMPVIVSAKRLDLEESFIVTRNQKSVEVIFDYKEITNRINYIDSKKIKIFVNNTDTLVPKHEIDFLKHIFPKIKVSLYW